MSEQDTVHDFIIRLEQKYGDDKFEDKFVADVVSGDGINLSVAADVLEELGRIDLFLRRKRIQTILTRCLLESNSVWIRDGALRGISYMDDSAMLVAVTQALAKETDSRLQQYMYKIIERFAAKAQTDKS